MTVIIDGVEYKREGQTRLMRGNHFYRIRRGKAVQIPDEWVGHTVHPQTMRKREQPKKMKKTH